MPPVGGLSLLVHLIIVLVAALARGSRRVVGQLRPALAAAAVPAEPATADSRDRVWQRVLSYTIVIAVFAVTVTAAASIMSATLHNRTRLPTFGRSRAHAQPKLPEQVQRPLDTAAPTVSSAQIIPTAQSTSMAIYR